MKSDSAEIGRHAWDGLKWFSRLKVTRSDYNEENMMQRKSTGEQGAGSSVRTKKTGGR
jgi:hypothetical protein